MENTKNLNKWKSFDFGLHMKSPSNTSEKSLEENCANIQVVTNSLSITPYPKKTFNFQEELEPKSVNDLAVHPKKIKELEDWLESKVINQSNSPMLLISGPSGSGKTTALKITCNSLGISISEWINPVDQDYEYTGENQTRRFLDFLSDSKYKSLFDDRMKSVTLVKDFPNVFIRQPNQFTEILEEFPYRSNKALVFICTDTSSSNLNLLRTLFKDEVLSKYNIQHITFNPCAPTLLRNALKRAQTLIKQNTDIFSQPSSATVEAIIATAVGDIRNAVNQFYLASLMNTGDLPMIAKKNVAVGTKRKRKASEVKIKGMERDENLGLFHGLGRVLNPKWTEKGNLKKINCDVEKLVNEFSSQPNNFISFLFENYVNYFGDIKDVAKAVDIVSTAAKFLERVVEKDELVLYALWLSVLGLMTYNQHRVSKWNQIRGPTKITKTGYKTVDLIGFDSTDLFYHDIIIK